MSETFIHQLDRTNFFYESIVTLAYTQFGINELFARGFLIAGKKTFPKTNDFVNYIESSGFPHEVKNQIYNLKGFTPMIFVPGFSTKDKTHTYQMEPNNSAVRFLQDDQGITHKNIELTHMTVITAWERIQCFNLADGPVKQFFRHIRNAAAHNGKFHFVKKTLDLQTGTLLKQAKWKNFEVTASLQGTPLIVENKNDLVGYFDQGDLVEFLLDFENHYPELKTKRTL
jgi:hypothetical protein